MDGASVSSLWVLEVRHLHHLILEDDDLSLACDEVHNHLRHLTLEDDDLSSVYDEVQSHPRHLTLEDDAFLERPRHPHPSNYH